MVTNDRREFQRLRLAKPILAQLDTQNALILDIGVGGAFIEHYGGLVPGQRFQLTFRWMGEDVTFIAEVIRTSTVRKPGGDMQSTVAHTAVHFVEGKGDAENRLHDMMATFVGKVLAAQKSNASGDVADSAGARILAQLGEARRMRTRGYISYHFKDGEWWRVPTDSALQPPDGFTVAAYEDEEELAQLCSSYETADEEGRRLIRLVAELSALSARKPF
jgi:hypothetical protein